MKRMVLFLVMLSLVGTACSATGSNTDSAGLDASETGQPLGDDGVVTLAVFMGFEGDPSQEDYRSKESEAQAAIQACMAAEGFEYIPFLPNPETIADVQEGLHEEFVKEFGFGISTQFETESDRREGRSGDQDPNWLIAEALDEVTREEYYKALYGGVPEESEESEESEEIERLMEELADAAGGWENLTEAQLLEIDGMSVESNSEWQPDGCENDAYHDVYSGDVDREAFYEEFGEDLEAIYSGIENESRIVAIRDSWSGCMADAGFEYGDQEEVFVDIRMKMGEIVTWPQYEKGSEGKQSEGISPIYDPAELADLQEYEVSVASAAFDCEGDLGVLYEELSVEYEQRFITDNLERLNAYKQANG